MQPEAACAAAQGKSPLAHQKGNDRLWAVIFLFDPRDLNGSGSEWSAGGAPEPRPAAAHGGQVPPSRTGKNSRPFMGRLFFAVAFLSAACYTFGVYARAERNILSQGGYEDEEEILDRDPYRRAAAESSAGDDAGGGGGRYVIDGD